MTTPTKKHPLRNPWLDADDPANAKRVFRSGMPGFWVPTPNEIEYACEQVRERAVKASGPDERKYYRSIKESDFPDDRKEIMEVSQLCDCPYWGTEFKDC